ncbi:MAG: hypothetical protein II085_00500, partial [Alphaproteobacteria bacterium]|nr:hypothetical protein [Alphaproteobacteria bacterium]
MAIKIQPANLYNPSTSRKFMKSMASNGLARFILLEACVEAGRTYYAFKRGGFDEARERITEEFSGALFWLGGVTALNALFEKLGQRLLKLPHKNVDIAHDHTRNPLTATILGACDANGDLIIVDDEGRILGMDPVYNYCEDLVCLP